MLQHQPVLWATYATRVGNLCWEF